VPTIQSKTVQSERCEKKRRRVEAGGVCSKGALGNDEDHLARRGPDGQLKSKKVGGYKVERQEKGKNSEVHQSKARRNTQEPWGVAREHKRQRGPSSETRRYTQSLGRDWLGLVGGGGKQRYPACQTHTSFTSRVAEKIGAISVECCQRCRCSLIDADAVVTFSGAGREMCRLRKRNYCAGDWKE
jgi:hypothetical protein